MHGIRNIAGDEKGWAMPLVIMVMVALVLLGTALWQYSVMDLRHAAREEDRMQAHYYARSAAEILAGELVTDLSSRWNELEGVTAGNAWVSSTVPTFEGEEVPVELKVYRESDGPAEYIVIESRSTVRESSETLIVEITADGSLFWRKL